jgi:hypothetical protein
VKNHPYTKTPLVFPGFVLGRPKFKKGTNGDPHNYFCLLHSNVLCHTDSTNDASWTIQ